MGQSALEKLGPLGHVDGRQELVDFLEGVAYRLDSDDVCSEEDCYGGNASARGDEGAFDKGRGVDGFL